MYNQPFFIPRYPMYNMPINMARMTAPTRGLGLLSRLGGSLGSLRGINWGGFINNASKTLGIINQTIPLVKQVGPMMNNMKSMLKLASIFKDETDNPNNLNTINKKNESNTKYQTKEEKNTHYQNQESINNTKKESTSYENIPTFFINS